MDHLVLTKWESASANAALAETEESSIMQVHSSSDFSSCCPSMTEWMEKAGVMLWSRSVVIQSDQQPQQGTVSFSKTTDVTDAVLRILEMSHMQGHVEQEF